MIIQSLSKLCVLLFLVSVVLIIDSSSAAVTNRPVLSITVRDGDVTNENNYFDYFCPTIHAKYSKAGKDPFPVDIQYGYFVAPSINRPSCSVWGKASQNIAGWRITAGAAVAAIRQKIVKQSSTTRNYPSSSSLKADIDMRAENPQNDISARIFASDMSISRIEFTKGYTTTSRHNNNNNNNRFTINPRYNPLTNTADVMFGYTTQSTSVKLHASRKSQQLSIAQQINESNVLTPTIGSDGDVSLRWEKQLLKGNDDDERSSYIATTLKPRESIHVEWKDGLWNANMNIPMDGSMEEDGGMHVGIRREVVF
uniref:Uncharacterized protein n=1 Tax=Helicotheca tamesis TaxID=374047 RepID=A0A7S2HS33_9STRA